MTLIIPNDILERAGVTEREALIELVFRLFDIGRLTSAEAASALHLERLAFEDLAHSRGIAVYRPTIEDIREDLENLKRIGL